jgi:hypothetical protein
MSRLRAHETSRSWVWLYSRLFRFFNFHALKFNSNTVLMLVWAATTLFFLRSFETRRALDAVLAGICAAMAMYGKYWLIVLLLGLAIAGARILAVPIIPVRGRPCAA